MLTSSSSAPPRSTTSTNFATNTYSGLSCNGNPTTSTPIQGGCYSSAPFVKISCVATSDDFPFLIYKANSVVLRSFTPGTTCAAPGVPVSISVIPLGTCMIMGSGSQKYSFNAATGLISLTDFAAAGCVGAGVPSTQSTNTCLEDSSITLDLTCSSGGASPAPVITTPTSAFLPAPFSGSGELTACTITAQQSKIGGYDTAFCGNLEKYTDFSSTKPTMSIAVFNPFGRDIFIQQMSTSACDKGSCTQESLPFGELVAGKTYIISNNLWISLSNVPCQTPSNPFAYCTMDITESPGLDDTGPYYWYWFRVDSQLGAILVAAALVVIVGAIIGVILACCCFWGAMHVFKCVVCPCFNCCCDRRKRSVGGAAGVTGFSVPSYPINPAAIGAAYSAQTYATTQQQQQQQQAAPSSSLTAKWDPSGRHA